MSEQRIYLRVRFPHPPARIFHYLADHEGLPGWLGVDRVEMRHVRNQGGAGTVRRVYFKLPGGIPTHLDETILRFDPPRRMAYRASPSLLFRRYEAELRFPQTHDGCFLEWTIRLATWLPGLGQIAALQLEQRFREGLHRLEARLGPGPGKLREGSLCRRGGSDPGPASGPEDEVSYSKLLIRAQEAAAVQAGHALALCTEGQVQDTRYWFLRVASLATAYTLDRVQSGSFQYPCWVLRLIIAAHRYMERNLIAAQTPGGIPETHWESWLRATDNAERWWPNRIRAAAHSVAKGTYIHISEDYTRALGEVFVRHYRSRPGLSYDTFLDDWRAMLPVHDQAWVLVRPEFELLPGPAEQLHAALRPLRARNLLLQDPLLGLQRQRQRAWERGKRLLTFIGSLEQE